MSGTYTEKEIKFYAVKYFDQGEMKEPHYTVEVRLVNSDKEDDYSVIDSGRYLSDVCNLSDYIEF